jgi:hypothetical protein
MLSRLAADVGKGLFAGAVGTAAMTVSSTVEAKLRGRADSSAPATAAAAVVGVEPVDDDARQRFNNLTHCGYGIGWGGAGRHLHHRAVGGAGHACPSGSGVGVGTGGAAGDRRRSAGDGAGRQEIAIDLLHHAVYVVATGLAYAWLDRD